MIPRNSSSKKWTPLPAELCQQITEVFEESFKTLSDKGSIHVDGRIYPEELLLRVGYRESNRLLQANFEVSTDFKSIKESALTQIHLAVDCAASMVQQFVDQEENLDGFPRSWSSIKIDKNVVFVQVSTVNTQLEAEADRLLGAEGDSGLLRSEDEDSTSEVYEMLGIDKTQTFESEDEAGDTRQVEFEPIGETSEVNIETLSETSKVDIDVSDNTEDLTRPSGIKSNKKIH